jgi:hypothetical protein
MPNPNDDVAVALAASDQRRLIHFLGMTGSMFDGEALTAARMANRTLKTAGATWADIVAPQPAPQRGPQVYDYIPRDWPQRWRWVACAILESGAPLYPGEAKLLRAVTVYRCMTPSAEQLGKLRCIADRVLKKAPPT